MFSRLKLPELRQALQRSPAVVLLGPRQVGKTTLALEVAQPDGGYLDLESPEDRNKLSNVEQYLRARQDRLIVLDGVQWHCQWHPHPWLLLVVGVCVAGADPAQQRNTGPMESTGPSRSNAAPRPS